MLTGAAGFVGAACANHLTRSGVEAILVVRRSSAAWRVDELRAEFGAQLRVVFADLTDVDAISGLVGKWEPRVVVNCAETSIHPASTSSQRIEAWRDSVTAMVTLLEAMRNPAVQRFVHVGSTLAYGRSSVPLCEASPERPSTVRGVYKLAGSLAARQWAAEQHRTLTELRPASVYGPRQQPERFVPSVFRSLRERTPFELTTGSPRHDFVFIDDVAKACVDVVLADAPPPLLNLGTGVETTNHELVRAAERVTGLSLIRSERPFPPRPSDNEHWVVDAAEARRTIQWNPIPLEVGLARTWEWFDSER
jgi:nucleoside-diphosphate-sugar epimerase